jgi:hypothetical protein
MKKLITVTMIVALLATVATSAASAQFTAVTSFQVQNLSNQTAHVQLTFYDSSGNVVTAATLSDTIGPLSNKLYTQSNNTNLPSGFNGSVVVSSDQPVAAIGIQESKNAASMVYQGTYGGFASDAASDKFYLPTIMKAFYGYSTEFSIQNAGSSNVDVTVTYSPGGYTDTKTGLKPGQVVRFNNASTSGMPNSYIGAGTVTTSSGGKVVAIVNQINATAYQEQTYEGFSAANAGTTLYTPVLMRGFYGFNTNVTILYSNGTSKTQTLASGAGYLFTQGNDAALPASWIGSARITSTASNIVAVVNQQNTSTGKAASYNAFATAGTHYVAPNAMKNFYGFNTSIQVQAIDSGTTTCTASFTPGGTSQTSPSLSQYGTYLFTQSNNASLGTSWIGSVDLTCGGKKFVAMVNQDGPGGKGDNAMAYDAIPAP